jgi:SPX domain protein involved in polyphosphate accumulation
MRGEYTVDADFQALVKKGKKSQQEADSMVQPANEVQYAVMTKRLQPSEPFAHSIPFFVLTAIS